MSTTGYSVKGRLVLPIRREADAVQFQQPALDAAFLAGALHWLMLILIAAALPWLLFSASLHRAVQTGDGKSAVAVEEHRGNS